MSMMRLVVRAVTVLLVAGVLTGADAFAAPSWKDFKSKCDGGKRVYSAVLMDIPWGVQWEKACQATPASVAGQPQRVPNRCVIGVHVWGEWDVADAACKQPVSPLHWGPITAKQCVSDGTHAGMREYSGILWGIPFGKSWKVCETTPASVASQPARVPDTCTYGANAWGIWWVRDDQCKSYAKPPSRPTPGRETVRHH